MIIIDAGHGGFDPGGGSNSYFKEKDLTKKISDYQKKRFDELGIPSTLVRTNDVTLNPKDRTNRIAENGAKESDILISNHINNGGSKGAEVIYSVKTDNELPNIIANELAKVFCEKIKELYKINNINIYIYIFLMKNIKKNRR